MSIIVLHLILRTVAKAAKRFVIVGIGGNTLLLPRTGNQTIKRGGKTPVSRSQCPYEPVPRAIVVYPAPLCPPLVVIPTRRILIPRCRFGILHTCLSYILLTCHSPQAPGVGIRGRGLLLIGLEYSTERKCSQPLLNADKDIDTAQGN